MTSAKKPLKTFFSTAFLFIFVTLPLVGFAADIPAPASGEITSAGQVINVAKGIVNLLYNVFFIVAVAFILFAAFTFLTAGGDEEKVSKAKKQLLYAVIAIVIAIVSYSAAAIISGVLASPPSLITR